MRCRENDAGGPMAYLSDMNLRAVLTVLIVRAGGQIDIANQELYDAMVPATGGRERFRVDNTDTGVRIFIEDLDDDERSAAPNERTGL
jgi:hypothetical protein